MSDILKRLKDAGDLCFEQARFGDAEVMQEASHEIQRLRSERRDFVSAIDEIGSAVKEAKKSSEKLRETLNG